MKKHPIEQSGFFNVRVLLAVALATIASAFLFVAFAASPTGGTITPAGADLAWNGTGTGLPPTGGAEDSCTEGTNCDSYTLTISGTPADWVAAAKQVHVQINWTSPSSDYDMYIHKGDLKGPVVASSGNAGTTQEEVNLSPSSSSIGTGVFTVHVIYYAATQADQYHGVVTKIDTGVPPVPAPIATTVPPRFEIYQPPALGPNTLGRGAGEPSIGVGLPIAGHPEGRAMFQADVQTLRVTFNGCAAPRALWENKPAPTSQQDFDPILFTDRATGRTFVHLLTFAGNVIAGEQSVTDTAPPFNDGDAYIPSKGSGIGSGIDHQTIGAGPYAPPLNVVPKAYPNAVYYCSQALVDASCARSDDGGINYGPSTVVYTSECGGLHGHVKVGPDGTVYLPNKDCGTNQAVGVSEDNGLTWAIRKVPKTTASSSDPSIGIGAGNRVYFGWADGDTKAGIATSNDHGKTWSQSLDVGAEFGINNLVFPAVVAGDNNRAAYAFLGTQTAGGLQGPKFNGLWHLYVATTYDGGATWKTVDATPNDPVQRGCVWLAGGANVCRNLLDFMDLQMDQQGRIMVGYADGCTGGECIQAPPNGTGNAYTALASIARQSGGPRLIASFDPSNALTATAPGAPLLSAKRNGTLVSLSWSQGDNGNSGVTSYKILRGTTAGSETLLATVGGTETVYKDLTATNTTATYFYKVVASNAQGDSCEQNEVSVRPVGDASSLSGLVVSSDPTGDQTGAPANADLDIQTLAVSEPATGPDAGKLVFNLKVADLSTSPNERMWRIIWNSPASPGTQYYVGMTKDQNGAISYEYGTVATATVGLVLGVQSTTKVGTPDRGAFTPAGLITIAVSKNKVGNPQIGDILGAMTARTFPVVSDTIRGTAAADTNANATNNDNTANAAVYAIVGTRSTQLQNISTRLNVLTGDNVGIGGFIVTGSEPKKVIVRGIGPSLAVNSIPVPGRMSNPTLELYGPSGLITTNDDWRSTQESEIQSTGIPPTDDREAAIVATLNPGLYTAVLKGSGGETGIAVVEIYDISPVLASQLANLSTRGFVQTGNNVLIGGFIVGPNTGAATRVVARAMGPSLAASGITNALPDPTMEVRNAAGDLVGSNDNWQQNTQPDQDILTAAGLAPTNPNESALVGGLTPGQYTVVVRNKLEIESTSGVGVVEIYNLGPQ